MQCGEDTLIVEAGTVRFGKEKFSYLKAYGDKGSGFNLEEELFDKG